MKKHRANSVKMRGDGPPCPRCGLATQMWRHRLITERELQRPFYYERWYKCVNKDCVTTMIMPDCHKMHRGKDVKERFTRRKEYNATVPAEWVNDLEALMDRMEDCEARFVRNLTADILQGHAILRLTQKQAIWLCNLHDKYAVDRHV